MQYGPVGMSAGQIKGSVTVPYTFQGEGRPLPRAVAARKAALVHTDEDDLWAKQPVGYTRKLRTSTKLSANLVKQRSTRTSGFLFLLRCSPFWDRQTPPSLTRLAGGGGCFNDAKLPS